MLKKYVCMYGSPKFPPDHRMREIFRHKKRLSDVIFAVSVLNEYLKEAERAYVERYFTGFL